MAAGPGVSMQCASPARELSLSVQHGTNQTLGDRLKPEETTGENAAHHLIYLDSTSRLATQANIG